MRLITIFFTLAFLSSCGQSNCPPDINKKPMYGQEEKCPEQIAADQKFLNKIDEIFDGDREAAAKDRINRAWSYFYKGHLDSSMMRFNQAWLLDSTNAHIYWGYGNLLGRKQKFNLSLKYLEKSLKLNPNNSNAWLSASTSYGQLFYQSKDSDFLDKCIAYLKKSIELDSTNAQAYGQLTAAYTYFEQKDSALKYLKITDGIDSSAIKSGVRKYLEK